MAMMDKTTRATLLGAGAGAGAVLALPYVGAVLAAIARPLTKALISGSMAGFEKASEKLAVAAESFQDLVAEVRAERTESSATVAQSHAEQSAEPDPRAN